jgi:hypothetical protein
MTSPCLESILHSFARYITSCPTIFDGQAIASVMCGVKSMPKTSLAVRGIMGSLAARLEVSSDDIILSTIELSLSINALQDATKDDYYAISLLKVFNRFASKLSNGLKRKVGFNSCTEISAALNGLRNIGVDHPDAKDITSMIISSLKFNGVASHFNEKELSAAFFALQNIHFSEHISDFSHELFVLLSDALARYTGKFSGRSVANIMYGLQNTRTPPPFLLKYEN